MKISSLGEFGLIDRISKLIKTDGSVVQGIGDDCAVIRSGRGKYLLATCDMLVEGVDFLPSDDRFLVGRKSLSVSVSDIASCGGIPQHALIALGLPKSTAVTDVDGLYRGLTAVAREFRINIVGGDISKAPRLTIDVSVIGSVEKKNLILRSGARVGDIIAVTGSFGGSITGKHLKFTPRLTEARYLVRHFPIHAMIDVSDGLCQDLRHIVTQSKVGSVVHEDMIPLSSYARGIDDALYSGEDFELLFTLPLSAARRLRRLRDDFSFIGEIVPQKFGMTIIDRQARQRKLELRGYRHF